MQIPLPPVPPQAPHLPGEMVFMHVVDQMAPVMVTLILVAGLLIAYAIRSRNRRLSTPVPLALGPVDDRLARLEQSVEAIGVEVERIAEGQRFVTKMLSDRPRDPAQLPSGR